MFRSFFQTMKRSRACNQLLSPFYSQKKRYRYLKKVGEGGLAQISSFLDTHLNRVIAVKKLNSENLEDAMLLRAFIHEAKLISYLEHPGIISLYDTFIEEEGSLCYSMKLVQGKDLYSLLEQNQKQNRNEQSTLLQIFLKICETLAYAHDKGVIHLDLKPENIMLGAYGEVYVMDWGNARLYQPQAYIQYLQKYYPEGETFSALEEKEDFIAGTPEYMSPEQTSLEREKLTPASDIFSLGVILYQMLTQRLPFEDTELELLLEKVRRVEPPPISQWNPEISKRLSQICMKMLEKSLADRYQSFHEVIADLKELSTSGQAFSTQEYWEGEWIFKEGDKGDYAFTILSGLVEISRKIDGERKVLAQLGPDEIVGELSIFMKQPRAAAARALQNTVIRVMTKKEVEEELEKLSPWVETMITGLSKRFLSLSDQLLQREPS